MPEKISIKNNNNLFTNKNFILLLLINILVIFSDKLVQLSVLKLSSQSSLSKITPIEITIVSILPYIFLAPLTGYLADKYKRKDILFKSILAKDQLIGIIGSLSLWLAFWFLISFPEYAEFFSNLIASNLFLGIFAAIYFNKKGHILTKSFLYILSFSFLLKKLPNLIFSSLIFLFSAISAFINIITLSLIPNIVQKSNLRAANALIISLNILLSCLVNSSLLGEEKYFPFIILSIFLASIISLILAKFIKIEEKNQLSVNKLQELLGQGKIKISEIDKIHSLEKSLKNQYQVPIINMILFT